MSSESLLVSVQARWHGTDWRAQAVCSKAETANLFFPVGVTGPAESQIVRAKEICAACPVRSACLEFAISTNQEYGIWGGTSEDERRILRREWRREQRAARAKRAS